MKNQTILYLALSRQNPALAPLIRVHSDSDDEKLEALGATLLCVAFWATCHTASERARASLDKGTTVSLRYHSLREAGRWVDCPISIAKPIRRMFRRMGSGRRHSSDKGGLVAAILSRVVITPLAAQDLEPVAEVWSVAFPAITGAFVHAMLLISYIEMRASDPVYLKEARRRDIREALESFMAALKTAFHEVEFRVLPPRTEEADDAAVAATAE